MAIRSGGGRISDCIVAPHSSPEIDSGKNLESSTNAVVLCYRAFLSPEITDDDLASRMVPLSWCRLADHDDDGSVQLAPPRKMICCNPYHYGLMVNDIASTSSGAIGQADEGQSGASFRQSDASLYDNVEKCDLKASGDDTGFFSDTSGTIASSTYGEIDISNDICVGNGNDAEKCQGARVKPWCHIAYWEENQRSGPLLPVTGETGLVYFDAPKPSAAIARSSLRIASLNGVDSTTIKRTRGKIGLGFALFRKKGNVWLYNRSQTCIFVRSNTCFRNRDRPLRLKPGCCCVVHQIGCSVPRNGGGPVESPTVLISFVKGWGRSYVRPFITCCPCWVQVIFAM